MSLKDDVQLLASSRVWYAPIKTCSEVGLALALCFAVSLTALGQTPALGVFTSHNDQARTSQNLNETILTPASVSSSNFGLEHQRGPSRAEGSENDAGDDVERHGSGTTAA